MSAKPNKPEAGSPQESGPDDGVDRLTEWPEGLPDYEPSESDHSAGPHKEPAGQGGAL